MRTVGKEEEGGQNRPVGRSQEQRAAAEQTRAVLLRRTAKSASPKLSAAEFGDGLFTVPGAPVETTST